MRIQLTTVFFPISSIILFLIVATISHSVESYPIKDSEELICPDSNPLNCYPKLFEATSLWKPIREGQVIEAGLDIRMNMDTLEKEARLDPDNIKKKSKKKGLAIGSADSSKGVVPVDNVDNALNQKQAQQPIVKSQKKGKAYLVHSGDFHGLMNYVVEFVQGEHPSQYDVLIEKLEELSELCSDVDFGVDFIDNLQTVLKLTGLYDSDVVNYGKEFKLTKGQYDKVKEVTTRCLSASLRNNEHAQNALSKYLDDPVDFMSRLMSFDVRRGNSRADLLLLRRRLGVLGALLNNIVFSREFNSDSRLKGNLLDLYAEVSDVSVRQRVLQILDDMKQQEIDISANRNIGKRNIVEDDQISDLSKMAKYTEAYLIDSNDNEVNEDTLKHLKRLEKLKKDNPTAFKASSGLLEWLNNQIYSEKARIKKRDLSAEDGDYQDDRFVDYLITLRNEVFGNRLGSRKHYLDEL